jgi:hypothetical protein
MEYELILSRRVPSLKTSPYRSFLLGTVPCPQTSKSGQGLPIFLYRIPLAGAGAYLLIFQMDPFLLADFKKWLIHCTKKISLIY